MSISLSPCRLIQPADVAENNEIKTKVLDLSKPPVLVAFLANNDPWAKKYAIWTGKTCTSVGINFQLRECEKESLEDEIIAANQDDRVNGIMVYYPVFGGSQDAYIQSAVSVAKDIEGLSHTYRFNMYNNIRFLRDAQNSQMKCTPLAIVKILEHINIYNPLLESGNRLYGTFITIINRSEVVGRPLAALLANDGACVYSIDETDEVLQFSRGSGLHKRRHETAVVSLTKEEAVRKSDVVITGVPSKSFKLPTVWLKDGVVAVNFSSEQNFEDNATSTGIQD